MLNRIWPVALLLFWFACAAGAPPGANNAVDDLEPPENSPADSGEPETFSAWLATFRQEAVKAGIDRSTIESAFADARYLPRVVERDGAQPEFSRRIWAYLDAAVSDQRVRRGRDALATHRQGAERAARQYGVRPEILIAIWGLESDYGRNFGDYPTVDALATLGFDGRRGQFARAELLAALKILASGDIRSETMRGSWAGAMGHPQFLPSSFRAYAVDADNDGRRDIWRSIDDVLASIANYLDQAGWRSGTPWGAKIALPESFDYGQAELSVTKSTAQWAAAGVIPRRGRRLPEFAAASVITPAGAHGPAFLVGPNFRVILAYNNATSYALAVAHLADRIVGAPALVGDWPRELAALSRVQIKAMQQLLNRQGYDAGEPDGRVGPITRAALRAFQRSQGLAADGFPTLGLLEKLQAQS